MMTARMRWPGLALTLFTTIAAAADPGPLDGGQREYLDRCAVCHGPGGKGDGGAIDILNTAPADLTQLTRKNGGVFPVDRVHAMIDGRQVVRGHGPRDMPIWGREYSQQRSEADAHFAGMPYTMDMYVRVRILSLIDYLDRIQAK